jgi:hypothetical protein
MGWDDGPMANRPALALALRDGHRDELARLRWSSSVRARWMLQARMLLTADGMPNTAIAEPVGQGSVKVS